jgi:hypothetical protein
MTLRTEESIQFTLSFVITDYKGKSVLCLPTVVSEIYQNFKSEIEITEIDLFSKQRKRCDLETEYEVGL